MSLQKCANFSDCGPISACATDTPIQPEYYPVLLLSMLSGEFCLRLKPYWVVKISSDVVTEHCCQLCVLAMMFCRSDCQLCAGTCGKWLRNQQISIHGIVLKRSTDPLLTSISIHIIANQNSYHGNKLTLQCFTCFFCLRLVRNVWSRRRFDSSSVIAHPVNFDYTQCQWQCNTAGKIVKMCCQELDIYR